MKSIFEVMEELAEIETVVKDKTKEYQDIIVQEQITVEEAKKIIIPKIEKIKTKSGLFKLLSDSLCFVIMNCKYLDKELEDQEL